MMTAQISDLIWIDGERQSLCVLPLYVLFDAMPHRPHFQARTTANWRGYQASWWIEADWLWLVGLSGKLDEERCNDKKPRAQAKEDWRDAIALIVSFEENERGAKLSRPCGLGDRSFSSRRITARPTSGPRETLRSRSCSTQARLR
jgi:hypothetical protein